MQTQQASLRPSDLNLPDDPKYTDLVRLRLLLLKGKVKLYEWKGNPSNVMGPQQKDRLARLQELTGGDPQWPGTIFFIAQEEIYDPQSKANASMEWVHWQSAICTILEDMEATCTVSSAILAV